MKFLDRLRNEPSNQLDLPPVAKAIKTAKNNGGKCKSKKHDLKKLEAGWNDKVYLLQHPSGESGDDLKASNPTNALAIFQSTGLRPDELHTGVTFFLEEDQVVIEIKGSKQISDANGTVVRGLEKRWITINPSFCMAAEFLCRYVKHQLSLTQRSVFDFKYNKNTFRNTMVALSDKFHETYRPKKTKISITAYFFRHHMSACLKADKELSPEQRAKVMGHLSTDSIESYASAYRRKSPVKPILKVRTSEEPIRKVQSSYIASKVKSKQQPSIKTLQKLTSRYSTSPSC